MFLTTEYRERTEGGRVTGAFMSQAHIFTRRAYYSRGFRAARVYDPNRTAPISGEAHIFHPSLFPQSEYPQHWPVS